MHLVCATILAFVAIAPLGPALAQALAPLLKPGPVLGITENLSGEDEDEPEGVSGIACRPATTDGRTCLVINDESQSAQLVQIKDGVLTPGEVIPVVGNAPSADTLGEPPRITTCPNKGSGGFDETDGEGVAFSDPYFYVVGSHGCSRKKGKFKLSSFILARISLDTSGQSEKRHRLETTYRLSDLLRRASRVGQFFGTQLQKGGSTDEEANGLNVEGIAVQGDTMLVGLRAPVDRATGEAFLLRVSVADLFESTQGKERTASAAVPDLIPLQLGKNVGIRDISFMPDGRLLVLAGPAQEQPVPYSLSVVDLTQGKVVSSWRLPPLTGQAKGGKAEAVTPLGTNRVLIMFDGLLNGAAREYILE